MPVVRRITADERRVSTQVFVISTPIVSFAFTAAIWDLPASDLGWIALSAAVLYALAAFVLRRLEGSSRNLSYTHALVALMLLTLAAILMLEGDALIFTLAAEAAILHYVARRFSDGFISVEAHLIFFAVAVWLGARLVVRELLRGCRTGGARHLCARGPAGHRVGLRRVAGGYAAESGQDLPDSGTRRRSRVALARALGAAGRRSIRHYSLGLYAVVLLVAGLRLDRSALIRVAMATLFLVAGKLFLVDLAEVEALWRVLLFLGFGVLFLSLSYYLQALWRQDEALRRSPVLMKVGSGYEPGAVFEGPPGIRLPRRGRYRRCSRTRSVPGNGVRRRGSRAGRGRAGPALVLRAGVRRRAPDRDLWVWLKRDRLGFEGRDVAGFSVSFAAGVLLGGRLFDVVLYEWFYYENHIWQVRTSGRGAWRPTGSCLGPSWGRCSSAG